MIGVIVPLDEQLVARIGERAALDLATRIAERRMPGVILIDVVTQPTVPTRDYRFRA